MSNYPHQRPNGTQPRQVAVTVPPQPVPVQVVVEQTEAPEGPLVVLRFFTPTGQAIYFLPIDAAKQVAQMIQAKATSVRLAQ